MAVILTPPRPTAWNWRVPPQLNLTSYSGLLRKKCQQKVAQLQISRFIPKSTREIKFVNNFFINYLLINSEQIKNWQINTKADLAGFCLLKLFSHFLHQFTFNSVLNSLSSHCCFPLWSNLNSNCVRSWKSISRMFIECFYVA